MCSGTGRGSEEQDQAAVDKRNQPNITSLPRILGPRTGSRGNGHPKRKGKD